MRLPSCKRILLLGDNESGKTTLIAKLQANEDPKKGCGLEYAYLDVRDEYRDDHTRLGVWILDGEPSHNHLLKFSLSEENFKHTTVLLVVSMMTPWTIMDSLHTWASLLQDHMDALKLEPDVIREHQRENSRRWRNYIEPGDELERAANLQVSSSSAAVNGVDNEDDVKVNEEPLPENVLTRNLGLDLMVVVTKTDYMSSLEKDYDYKDEHFDFIQKHVREFCLQYGASLCYCSVKEDKNCDLLYKYLVHRIYGFPFRTPALVVEKDAVFIPSGWDSYNKISILHENMQSISPDDDYTDVIARPIPRKVASKEAEVHAEEEQVFLGRHLQLLQSSGSPAAKPAREPGQSPAGVHKTRPQSSSSPGQAGPPKKPGTPATTTSSEGVLANFFNSLLSKKTGTSNSSSPKMAEKAISRTDAAVELDRLTENSISNSEHQETSSEC